MKAEKLIITTTVGNRSKTEMWDTSTPIGIGHPFKWVLESTPHGLRVRDLAGGVHQVRKDGIVKIGPEVLEKGEKITLPSETTDRRMFLTLKRAQSPKPAYAARPAPSTSSIPQLMVFEGVRRTLVNSQGVHSAYVAYSKGRPVFTVYHNAEGFRVKPLLNGVHLKLKGEKAVQGKPGEFWDLNKDQMMRATIVRGWYWWRFSLVAPPPFLDEDDEKDAIILTENRVFRNALIGVSAMLVAAVTLTLFQPKPEEKKEEPVVPPKLIVHFKKVNLMKDKGPVEVAKVAKEKPHVEADERPKQEAKAPGEHKAEKKPGKTVVKKEVPHPKAMVEAPKEKPMIHPDPKPAKVVAPKVVTVKPEKTGAQKVADSMAALRSAMGGAGAVAKRDVTKDINGGSPHVGDLFAKSGAAYAPTEIKAGSMHGGGGGALVRGIGGGGGGGGGVAKGEGGGDVGYGTGAGTALVGGKGGGFVSLDNGGSEVEEGLTKEEVGRVIHAHMSEVRYCHEAAMLANPKVEGKLMIHFVINAGGRVETADIQSSNLPDHSLESCIVRRLVTWQFPHPKGGVKVNVAYPFLFKLLGGV